MAILIAEVLFKQFLICTTVYELNIADNEYFPFQTIIGITGVRGALSFGVWIAEVLSNSS